MIMQEVTCAAFPVISSLFLGKTQSVPFGKKEVETAIFKNRSQSSHYLSKIGLVGDEQADKIYHGGSEKALCVYLVKSYEYWDNVHQHPLEHGAFGENLTLSSLTEEDVCIGDIFQMGEVVVQVSQPRQPCFKLGIRNDWKDLTLLSRESGFTGFYLRVLQEGIIHEGMELIKIGQSANPISIKKANHTLFSNSTLEEMMDVCRIAELSPEWKVDLEKKLAKYQLTD